jgi:hypothetical protein
MLVLGHIGGEVLQRHKYSPDITVNSTSWL